MKEQLQIMQRYAFISYNHQDVKEARWLQHKLESYRLPVDIHNEFVNSRFLRPVFRDQEDLNTGILSDELARHLATSKFLIVICSRHSAKSQWVSKEVQQFIEYGRLDFIIPILVDTPANNDPLECLPEYLRNYTQEHPEQELLIISLKETGREQAFVRIVSRMLGVDFDVLWQRHHRAQRRKRMITGITVTVALALLYYLAVPVSLTVRLTDDTHNLPPTLDARLIVEDVEYSVSHLDTIINVDGFPGYYRGRSLQINLAATYYQQQDSSVRLGFGLKNEIQLTAKRDSTFACFCGKLVNEEGFPVPDAKVSVNGIEKKTDESGQFSFIFSTTEQSEYKSVEITCPGYIPLKRDKETPGRNIIYVLRRM